MTLLADVLAPLIGRAETVDSEPQPFLAGRGPAEFATSTALMPYSPLVWDVNRYYRELGVPSDATRRQIREAYQALDGQSSGRLTYIVHQLLDPEVRARYDAAPWGTRFFDDYVETEVRLMRATEVSRLLQQGYREEDLEPFDLLDYARLLRHDAQAPLEQGRSEPPSQKARHPRLAWSYYVWGTAAWPYEGTVRQWQEALIMVLSKREESIRIAVGLHGDRASSRPVEVRLVGYRLVVFLHEHKLPSLWLAFLAVARVVTMHRRMKKSHAGARI